MPSIICPKCKAPIESGGEGQASPTECPKCGAPLTSAATPTPAPSDAADPSLTGRQVYNVVTDVGVGVNVRLKDNLFQALAIIVCIALGIGIGALVVTERLLGAVLGGIIGLLVGAFGSGIFLMIFRFIMHVRGKHD